MALVEDLITLDGNALIEIVVAFAAYFVLSFLWWGLLLGKAWARQMGMDADEQSSMKSMVVPLLLQALGSLLMAFVFWHVMMAFSFDVDADRMTSPSVASALEGAAWTWLGFFVPVQLGRVAWEKASWTLFGINAGGHLVALMGMALAFALL